MAGDGRGRWCGMQRLRLFDAIGLDTSPCGARMSKPAFVVTIQYRHNGYVSSISGTTESTHHYVRAGLTPYDAACKAMSLLTHHGRATRLGGTIMAPPEVLRWIPDDMRTLVSVDPITEAAPAVQLLALLELRVAGRELLTELNDLESLFRDDESFGRAYRKFKALLP
jgi:hypothetical protein